MSGVIRRSLHKIDMFGAGLSFTFKGESKHTTICGGLCTVFSVFILVCLYAIKAVDFFDRVDPHLSMIENVLSPDYQFDIYEYGYRLAITNIEPKYGRIKAEIINKTIDELGRKNEVAQPVNLVPCNHASLQEDSKGIFSPQNKEQFNMRFKAEDFLCLEPG